MAVAPYEVEVVPLDVNDDVVWPVAARVAEELLAAGVEVIVDDRKERPGVKFADADLMGFPYQVVCGKKAIKNGNVELKVRATGERTEVAIDEVGLAPLGTGRLRARVRQREFPFVPFTGWRWAAGLPRPFSYGGISWDA